MKLMQHGVESLWVKTFRTIRFASWFVLYVILRTVSTFYVCFVHFYP